MAFEWCSSLNNVIIPVSVESIGYGAFTDAVALFRSSYRTSILPSLGKRFPGVDAKGASTLPERRCATARSGRAMFLAPTTTSNRRTTTTSNRRTTTTSNRRTTTTSNRRTTTTSNRRTPTTTSNRRTPTTTSNRRTPTTSVSGSSSEDPSTDNTGLIIGITVGVLLIILLH